MNAPDSSTPKPPSPPAQSFGPPSAAVAPASSRPSDLAEALDPALWDELPRALAYARECQVPEPWPLVCRALRAAAQQHQPDRGPFRPLFWSILKRACCRAVAHARRRHRRFVDISEVFWLAAPSPHDPEARAQLRQALARALKALPYARRHIFWHRCFLDHPNPQILGMAWAQRLKLTDAGLRCRFCRARQLVRRRLRAWVRPAPAVPAPPPPAPTVGATEGPP